MTVSVLCLFLLMPCVGLQCVIVALPGQTHLLLHPGKHARVKHACVNRLHIFFKKKHQSGILFEYQVIWIPIKYYNLDLSNIFVIKMLLVYYAYSIYSNTFQETFTMEP